MTDPTLDSEAVKPGERTQPGEQESEKINCLDCAHYEDCPRMKGVEFCFGRQEWLLNRSKNDLDDQT
jgi:hypothetical protein